MKRYVRSAAIVALVLVFGAAGVTKLVAAGLFHEQFAHFGLPAWWVQVTGAVELAGAALIALPKPAFRRSGAMLLAATMAVAAGLHLVHDPIALALPAVALMLLAGYVATMPRNEGAMRGQASV